VDNDPVLDLFRSLIHERPSEPRQACSANRRDKWGRRVAECSFQPGHENDHRDVHTGRTWK
jgi:hypothetical protein